MQEKPYFCPNCRSNRYKFKVILSSYQQFTKDPVTGAIDNMQEPVLVEEAEPTISCGVCGFTGNEMRFVKQAEREPRTNYNPAVHYS
jgi:hypothetical protein